MVSSEARKGSGLFGGEPLLKCGGKTRHFSQRFISLNPPRLLRCCNSFAVAAVSLMSFLLIHLVSEHCTEQRVWLSREEVKQTQCLILQPGTAVFSTRVCPQWQATRNQRLLSSNCNTAWQIFRLQVTSWVRGPVKNNCQAAGCPRRLEDMRHECTVCMVTEMFRRPETNRLKHDIHLWHKPCLQWAFGQGRDFHFARRSSDLSHVAGRRIWGKAEEHIYSRYSRFSWIR